MTGPSGNLQARPNLNVSRDEVEIQISLFPSGPVIKCLLSPSHPKYNQSPSQLREDLQVTQYYDSSSLIFLLQLDTKVSD